ncbi:MAG: AI-2E family transporter [Alphaproteobacteria bacterium]|nr:AI-2E family transporter [Alphaproteobacteria bacterium]
MIFDISKFIQVNRAYFIWATFMGLLYLFRDMFGLVFITFIMCFIVSGITGYIRQRYNINRKAVVIGIYILFLIGVIAFLTIVPPKLLAEAMSFTDQLPNSIKSTKEWLSTNLAGNEFISPLLPQIKEALFPDTLLVSVWTVVRSIIEKGLHYFGWFFLAMLFSFLIMLDLPHLSKGVKNLRYTKLADSYKETADSIMLFAKVVGENFRAQLLISTINTILTAMCLYVLDIKAIALLCTIVFMCGLIPVLGMIISSVPIVLMAVNTGGMELGFWAIVMIIGIHMIETYILNPRIVSSIMRINPVMTLIILYIAHSVIGLWGMLLGVPIAVYMYRKISLPNRKKSIRKILSKKE